MDRHPHRRSLLLSAADGGEDPSATCRIRLSRNLARKKRANPPTEKRLDGEQEAKAHRHAPGPPPKGYANWTLRLLARKVVELEIVDAISHETVRRTLKKTA